MYWKGGRGGLKRGREGGLKGGGGGRGGSEGGGRGGLKRGGEGGSKGGGGGGQGGLAGTPLLPGSPFGPPPKAGRNPKSSWHRRRRSKILAVSLKHWKGRRGGVWGGRGVTPHPPAVYSCMWGRGGGWGQGSGGKGQWGCHSVMVSTPGPTSRRRQLPAVPAGPEWHNTAASATPCATLCEPPPPFPALSLSTPHGMGSYRADDTAGPPCRSLCTQGPQCIQFCQSNKFCMGTHPMPPVLPEVINSAWAHTQCLRFCQK